MPGSDTTDDQPLDYQLLYRLDECFDAVLEALEQVAARFEAGHGSLWAWQQPDAGAEWLREALFDMWHRQGQDGRETRNYVGLVAADPTLMDAAAQANAAKDAFSRCLQEIKRASPGLLSEGRARLPLRHPGVNRILERTGLARLHLKQCWRHLPVAEAPVARVRFAWYSSGRSIKRLSVAEAEQKLMTLDVDAPHVRIQLQKLAGIPSGEPLAQVQPQAPLMRANLFFVEPVCVEPSLAVPGTAPTAAGGYTRRSLNVALPIFVPSADGRLPHTNEPPLTPPEKRTRAKRRDEKLEDEPFLPSLRVYRYR